MCSRAADDSSRCCGRQVDDLEGRRGQTKGGVTEVGGYVVAEVGREELRCQIRRGRGVEGEVGRRCSMGLGSVRAG